ncbi:MAG: hypothetical protein GY760_14800 [Deltaproteobacteria bacterium]|nr:hypothetical protein [Deltaproteobacteria bacterium]
MTNTVFKNLRKTTKLRYLFSLIKMMKIPGLFKVVKDWQSCIRFHFIHSALDCGLISALIKPQTMNDLIEKLKVKRPELLHALLDVGISTGELSFKNGVYKLKGKISKSIITKEGDGIGALIQANVTYYNLAYRELTDRMQGGELRAHSKINSHFLKPAINQLTPFEFIIKP